MRTLLQTTCCALCALLIFGCDQKAVPPVKTMKQANTKLLRTLTDELQLNATITPLKNTVWIYIPLEEELVRIKGADKGPVSTSQSQKSLSLRYLDVNFLNGRLVIEYDIANIKTYLQSLGYESAYSEDYQKLQQSVLNAIARAYGDIRQAEVEDAGTPYEHGEKSPQFIIFVIADIKNGLQIKTTIYYEDLSKVLSMMNTMPVDEYQHRFIIELTGDKAIVDDQVGEHLTIEEMTMKAFLAKQVKNRINTKYSRSMFPPGEDAKAEILKQIYETFDAYAFDNFTAIDLMDLNSGNTETIDARELEAYKPEEPSGGKFHVINFF